MVSLQLNNRLWFINPWLTLSMNPRWAEIEKKRKTPRPKHQNIKTYSVDRRTLQSGAPLLATKSQKRFVNIPPLAIWPYDTHRFINHILSLYGSFPNHGGNPNSHPFDFRISFINHPFLGTSILGHPHIAYMIFELFIYDFPLAQALQLCHKLLMNMVQRQRTNLAGIGYAPLVLKKTTPHWGVLSHGGSPKSWIFNKKWFSIKKNTSSYWGSPIESWPVLVEVFRAMQIAQQGSEQVTRSPMTHGGFIIHKKPRGRARKLGWFAKYESWWGSHLFWPQSKDVKKVCQHIPSYSCSFPK